MSKTEQMMAGRLEGMEFALRLAKDQGIEALEKEVKFRRKSGISLNVTAKELDAASEKIKEMTFDTMLVMSLAVLHDEFGFGQARTKRFLEKFKEGSGYLMEGLASWEDYVQAIKERLKLDIEIHWND